MSLKIYRAVVSKRHKTGYIIDDEGILYIKFLPHPDGDPYMTTEGVDIILDLLKINPVEGKTWIETKTKWELEIEL
jgi:hypothetical protein